MRLALNLALRARGETSPNPMVGAVLTRRGRIVGRGWHHRAGEPHAEIEAIRDALARQPDLRGTTLYVTLEPCSTHGRTPPCTEAILSAGIQRVVVAATDPNLQHAGRAFSLLTEAGVRVDTGLLADQAHAINEAFNHWIVHRTPFVVAKAALTLDGKIATVTGESQWITSPEARAHAMQLRAEADAILVGIRTVLADNPHLTVRPPSSGSPGPAIPPQPLRRQPLRIVLDSRGRTPLTAHLLQPPAEPPTLVVVTRHAPPARVRALRRRAEVWVAPEHDGQINLPWLLRRLGRQSITHLLVEGGGEVHASFFQQHLVHRVAFFIAPIVLGGRTAPRAVAGPGACGWTDAPRLEPPQWQRFGPDLYLTARVSPRSPATR